MVFLSHTTGDMRCLTEKEVQGTAGRRWKGGAVGTRLALFVVVKTKDVIAGLPLLEHTLQTESHNTYRNPGWEPST